MRIILLSLALLAGATASGASDEIIMLETPTMSPSVAQRLVRLPDGRAALTWLEKTDQDHALRLSLFDGQAFSTPITIRQGADFFVNWADTPGIAASPKGPWLAHWLQRSGRGTYAYDVVASLSQDEGKSWSAPFSPHNDGTLTEHGFVSYYPAGDQKLGMVWLDGRQTMPAEADHNAGSHHGAGGPMTLRTALVDEDGNLSKGALLDDRVCDCCATASALTNEGPVVVYRDRSETEIRDIKLLRHDGRDWSDPVIVHDDGWRVEGCPVNGPAVIARGQTVIVAWFTLDGESPLVRVAASTDGGRHFDAPVELDRGTAIGRVGLAWTSEGFALSWMAHGETGGEIRLAYFDQQGQMKRQRKLAEVNEGRSSGIPRLLEVPETGLMLAWTGKDETSGRSRVFTALIPAGD